jgi:solute carrier family 25 aspartate/glutamate transporter 12/13
LYSSSGQRVSWSVVVAFDNVVRHLDLIQHITSTVAKQHKIISKSDFLNTASECARFSVFTPTEIDILFQLGHIIRGSHGSSGGLAATDLEAIWLPPPVIDPIPSDSPQLPPSVAGATAKFGLHTSTNASEAAWVMALRQVYNFAIGSVAGAIGATVVYPIDLVKTRMQNQRSSVVGELMYKNSFDCFKKVVKNEGFKGLYSGLGPQLVGVAPEKAIKLTMNVSISSVLSTVFICSGYL